MGRGTGQAVGNVKSSQLRVKTEAVVIVEEFKDTEGNDVTRYKTEGGLLFIRDLATADQPVEEVLDSKGRPVEQVFQWIEDGQIIKKVTHYDRLGNKAETHYFDEVDEPIVYNDEDEFKPVYELKNLSGQVLEEKFVAGDYFKRNLYFPNGQAKLQIVSDENGYSQKEFFKNGQPRSIMEAASVYNPWMTESRKTWDKKGNLLEERNPLPITPSLMSVGDETRSVDPLVLTTYRQNSIAAKTASSSDKRVEATHRKWNKEGQLIEEKFEMAEMNYPVLARNPYHGPALTEFYPNGVKKREEYKVVTMDSFSGDSSSQTYNPEGPAIIEYDPEGKVSKEIFYGIHDGYFSSYPMTRVGKEKIYRDGNLVSEIDYDKLGDPIPAKGKDQKEAGESEKKGLFGFFK